MLNPAGLWENLPVLLLGDTGYFSFMSEKHTAGAGSPLVDGGNEVCHITL
jgi:hypothetical protein